MAKTLIIGATGHLGQELVKACKEQGQEVHALVRPSTRKDTLKMKALEASGAKIREGDLENHESLVVACKAVDNVVSAVGSFQIGSEMPLVKAVQEAGVKRFIPSDFGLDPKAAGPNGCMLFDLKAAVHEAVKQAGIPYTFIHTGGFFSYWVLSLGDLSKLGQGPLPPAEVNVYGDGNVRGPFVSVSDLARVTARALDQPALQNKELRITANPTSQAELIDLWQKQSGKTVKRIAVSAADVEKIISTCTTPDQGMVLVGMQLHRSMWIAGDSLKQLPTSLDVSAVMKDFRFQAIADFLRHLPA